MGGGSGLSSNAMFSLRRVTSLLATATVALLGLLLLVGRAHPELATVFIVLLAQCVAGLIAAAVLLARR
jgi:hypothetical protein